MKTVLTFIFVIIIIIPMFLYLNPFTWGMRPKPFYKASPKTEALIANLNTKYKIEIEISEDADTIWYFRDIKNKKRIQKENFELFLHDQIKNISQEKIKGYVDEFSTNFEHKDFFDSIVVSRFPDSIIYKTKIR